MRVIPRRARRLRPEDLRPLYSLASDYEESRQLSRARMALNKIVELEPRKVTIHELSCTDYTPPFVAIEVTCSAGTYLRSLAHDLGEVLGTGGTLWDLRRSASGPFTIDHAVPVGELDQIGPERVVPMAAAALLPSYEVSRGTAERVRQGVQLARPEVRGVIREGLVQLVYEGKLVALVEAHRGVAELRTVRVFLEWTKV